MFTPRVHLAEPLVDGEGLWLVIDDRQQVLLIDGVVPRGSTSPVPSTNVHLLGTADETPVWAVAVGLVELESADLPDDASFVHLRALYGSIAEDEWVLAGRAAQVLAWDRDHQFCGRCGHRTDAHESDRARICPTCGLMAFPRISPAVIMLIEREVARGPEVLLAWGAQFPGRFFSALAGFVEPGESLEQCVEREVREEVGIEIEHIRYFGSQPWPFPHSLMVGFNADYVSGEIEIQEEEIVEAGWFSPNELPPVPRGGMSIAGWLIEDWLHRVGARQTDG